MYPIVRALSDVTIAFSRAYADRKKQEGLMEFTDMEHYVLDILVDKTAEGFTPERAGEFPSSAARELQKKYKEIMIDEYQDTNDVQELIATLLSNGRNRFMVGDVKQSIYRFRQADPTISKRNTEVFPLMRMRKTGALISTGTSAVTPRFSRQSIIFSASL